MHLFFCFNFTSRFNFVHDNLFYGGLVFFKFIASIFGSISTFPKLYMQLGWIFREAEAGLNHKKTGMAYFNFPGMFNVFLFSLKNIVVT